MAVAALQKTTQLYKTGGKFRQAAAREKEIATILATEGGDLAGALEAFENAGELYASEDATASVPPFLRRMALRLSLTRSRLA